MLTNIYIYKGMKLLNWEQKMGNEASKDCWQILSGDLLLRLFVWDQAGFWLADWLDTG